MAKRAEENVPLECKYSRSKTSKLKYGAHVGMSGGISSAVLNAMNIGANSFALFLKSPRRWVSPDIGDEEAEKFIRYCKQYGYDPRKDILPHGLYFINLANPIPENEEKSYNAFLDDLRRCEKLNIGHYNFHPGSSLNSDHEDALKRLAKNINRAISETLFVKIVIENMAGHGNLVGSKIEDIREVIEMVEDKSRVGVCVDTCHLFAAGYDIRTQKDFDVFWKRFDEVIGMEYLSAIHLNDSKAPLGANKDLHQRLGYGFLGLETFRVIANNPKLEGIPLVLETPVGNDDSIYGEEIKLLEWLEGKSEDDQAYIEKRDELARLGLKEREEQLKKFEVKKEKELKKTTKKASKKTTKSFKRNQVTSTTTVSKKKDRRH